MEEREWLLLLLIAGKVVNGEGGEGCLIGAAFISVNCDGDANTLLSLTPENQRFSLNLGRPLFLCLMSMHVLDLSRETHRLQGLDTIMYIKKNVSTLLFRSMKYYFNVQSHAKWAFLQLS
jgi:hypothetical protein